MISRSAVPVLRAARRISSCHFSFKNVPIRVRKLSSSSTSSTLPVQPSSSIAAVGTLTNEIDKLAPRFELDGSQIQILRTPSEFYETLKEKIKHAKRRIFLSTLYIGKTEHELIETLRESLKANPDVTVSILTDALRGTRETPDPSTASLLAPLVAEFGEQRVEIRMFHTPNLTGVRKRVVPNRINEGWGLQHMKLYGVDDELIMSGANLSNDYFTNRQDRYHVFADREVVKYYSALHDAVCCISFRIRPGPDTSGGYTMSWEPTNAAPSPLEGPSKFIAAASKSLQPFTSVSSQIVTQPPQTKGALSSGSKTVLYPLVQLTPLLNPDTSTELPALRLLLRSLASPAFAGHSWTFTAGYFNMTPETRDLLLRTNPSHATVVAASPWANGFYGSAGVSGMLPAAYTLLARRFVRAVKAAGRGEQVRLKEWRKGTVGEKGGWTYHAKGLWVTMAGEKARGPSMTLVGSSNYTKRSHQLDLEANALIVTRDAALMKRLGEEETWLQDHAKVVEEGEFERTERRVGLHVRIAMLLVSALGGAL
ncbi:phospholipase D/nuclease [Eremomyces bilateralis CBS 781.70]|uniref:CDP-diacylglycerol--glycerol-3-phosphate 3-phosphatidyltransferase n=1 Tax=Eremomyces bilateralis CBS 781.70 TaxID=1392243 RepID=A0A6G1G5B6_9PEZI|nr:phospholipase D/nuclease [Eremomyces bilateralis CBS 781.70]KAF1813267.1 phospholipase D/nuclease [Eremomyces bilateralis CBS 781.70]